MAYLGSKANSKGIIEILNNPMFNDYDYLEPFFGYGRIGFRVTNKNSYTLSDYNTNLVKLYAYLQSNPTSYPVISKDEYYRLKTSTDPDDTNNRVVAAFAYSWFGKEFGSYVPISRAQSNLNYYDKIRTNSVFIDNTIRQCDYGEYNPVGKLIYCDPPYESTCGYRNNSGGKNHFDHDKFWSTIREWSKSNWVLVSEYHAPSDFVSVNEYTKKTTLNGAGTGCRVKITTEKMFIHESRLEEYKKKLVIVPVLAKVSRKRPCKTVTLATVVKEKDTPWSWYKYVLYFFLL